MTYQLFILPWQFVKLAFFGRSVISPVVKLRPVHLSRHVGKRVNKSTTRRRCKGIPCCTRDSLRSIPLKCGAKMELFIAQFHWNLLNGNPSIISLYGNVASQFSQNFKTSSKKWEQIHCNCGSQLASMTLFSENAAAHWLGLVFTFSLIFFSIFLPYCLYILYQHRKYAHIPGPPLDK